MAPDSVPQPAPAPTTGAGVHVLTNKGLQHSWGTGHCSGGGVFVLLHAQSHAYLCVYLSTYICMCKCVVYVCVCIGAHLWVLLSLVLCTQSCTLGTFQYTMI